MLAIGSPNGISIPLAGKRQLSRCLSLQVMDPDIGLGDSTHGYRQPFAIGRETRANIVPRRGDERLALPGSVDPDNRSGHSGYFAGQVDQRAVLREIELASSKTHISCKILYQRNRRTLNFQPRRIEWHPEQVTLANVHQVTGRQISAEVAAVVHDLALACLKREDL